MFGLFDWLKIGAGALAGFALCVAINALLWAPAAEREAREAEAARLNAATQKAIGELTNEADRARVNRRLCLERGGLYLNAPGRCVERPDTDDG